MLDWLGERYQDPLCIEASRRIEGAVSHLLGEGKLNTADLGGDVSTSDVADAVAQEVQIFVTS
jgi:3-isopropylmalate dehydrogenase